MQYEQTTSNPRYARGKDVVQRAARLLDRPLRTTTLLRNTRIEANDRQAWEIGAILATAKDEDLEAAAKQLAAGIARGHLVSIGDTAPQASLRAYA